MEKVNEGPGVAGVRHQTVSEHSIPGAGARLREGCAGRRPSPFPLQDTGREEGHNDDVGVGVRGLRISDEPWVLRFHHRAGYQRTLRRRARDAYILQNTIIVFCEGTILLLTLAHECACARPVEDTTTKYQC